MKLDFSAMEETRLEKFNGGEGALEAKMFLSDGNKILLGHLEPGASIGMHSHTGTCEIIYVLSGEGRVLCDGAVETLLPGEAHYCPEGHAHSLRNDGGERLCFFAVVPKQ